MMHVCFFNTVFNSRHALENATHEETWCIVAAAVVLPSLLLRPLRSLYHTVSLCVQQHRIYHTTAACRVCCCCFSDIEYRLVVFHNQLDKGAFHGDRKTLVTTW